MIWKSHGNTFVRRDNTMKKSISRLFILVLVLTLTVLTACSEVDTSSSETASKKNSVDTGYKYKDVIPPEISSDDRVMSAFIDISLYNVENYAEIYLGKDFKINAVFDGITIKAPADFKFLTDNGFTVADNQAYNGKSLLYAGDKEYITFKSPSGNLLNALFYNDSAKSKAVEDCILVKYECQSNFENNEHLSVNGVSRSSALSEVITKLGYPSHFHKENDGQYSLDYFLDKKDLRNRITIYANTDEDTVTSVSFSDYTK